MKGKYKVYFSVSQTVIRGDSQGGPQAVSERKSVAEIVSDTVRMKNTPVHVCAKLTFNRK
jgi:hypothetical protein